MPRRPPPASPKDRCRAAYQGAKKADPKVAAWCDRIWSETLLAADSKKPEKTRAEMYRRTEVLFNILNDRTGWLDGRMWVRRA
jgi:hypothetical protein